MELHKILQRQLDRLKLDEAVLPENLKQWQDFITRVNQRYIEADQERYLLERSMDISSREMQSLNARSEEAQRIAQMGYWHLDVINEKTTWSKELYMILGFDTNLPALSLDKILGQVSNGEQLSKLLETASKEGKSFETEFCITDKNKVLKWFYVIGHPKIEADGSVSVISGIVMDISKRKEAEEKLNLLNQQLLTSARKAGMTDVATAILHNVGNVLNSVNVSIGLIMENVNLDNINKLTAVEKLIMDNKNNLGHYFTNDEKGKLVPDYLCGITQRFANQYKLVNTEILNLKEKLEHIKEITMMQKSLGGLSEVYEKIFLPEVIDAAISICMKELERKGINITKKYVETPFIVTDKAKLMQILINLIQNAKDALTELANNEKSIAIEINYATADHKSIQISIEDNGVGILEENLVKIFSFGFTTKVHGHGFGLHSSALTAKELGGSLEALSQGSGFGAKFILTLPVTASSKGKENEQSKYSQAENYSH